MNMQYLTRNILLLVFAFPDMFHSVFSFNMSTVWLSYRHVQYPGLSFGVPMPVNMVTALVDSIHSEDMEIRPRHDLKLRGHISWVGRTSMEVTMELLSVRSFVEYCGRPPSLRINLMCSLKVLRRGTLSSVDY